MKEISKIALNPDQIKDERKRNSSNIKNTIKKQEKGNYEKISSDTIDLATDNKFWIKDNGISLNINPNDGINFYHEFSLVEKGIILDQPLKGDFVLKFKLKYQVIVNFLLGTKHLINFRNKQMKNDFELKTNVWHDMEFSRKNGLVSIKADGNLIRTLESDGSLFIIRVYNDNREVNIKEFYAKIEYFNQIAKNREQLLEDRITYLEDYINKQPSNEEVLSLKKELAQYKNITEKVLDSYNYLFTTIYMDYELKPKTVYSNLHLLILELMEFVRNVCKKYDLEFWLDAGNLLGAVRHEGFIPWDDDADLAMTRKDFFIFEENIQKEIDEHNLSEYVKISYFPREIDNQKVDTFMAVRVYHKMKTLRGRRIIANVDVIPYDFMTEYEEKGFNQRRRKSRENIYRNKLNNVSREEYLKQYYEELNLTFEKADYVLPGIDAIDYNSYVTETANLLPLKEIKFEDRTFPCPNNPDGYLRSIYGDYMSIPKVLHRHRRMATLRYNENNNEIFEKCIAMFKEVNENF